MTNYRLELAARASSGLGAAVISDVLPLGHPQGEVPFTYSQNINGAGTLDFTLPIEGAGVTPANFYPGRELHLYRNAGAGETLVWAGHLWTIDVTAPWVRILGMGWYETLRHRQLRTDFFRQAYEQLDAAWEMIAYTQGRTNGNIGLTRASAVASGHTATLTYCAEQCQGIAEAIEDLAAADAGFDFAITPNKAWTTYYPKRGTDRSGSITLNAATNVSGLAYTVDGTQIENDVAGIGPTKDCDPIHFSTVTDASSQATYGLMDATVTRDAEGQDTDLLDSLIAEELQMHAQPRRQPTVTLRSALSTPSPPNPLAGDYDIGDYVTLAASWGFATFSSAHRVLGYQVAVDPVGQETLDLTVDASTS